ncbi:MAG: SBBP repeat-containing protein [Ignavibacteria bacterium]|nr:SBBP repeat-containing protein [Ignavibacteria bacterium]
MAIDNSGNVYVTGYSKGSLTKWDIVTIKYKYIGIHCGSEIQYEF